MPVYKLRDQETKLDNWPYEWVDKILRTLLFNAPMNDKVAIHKCWDGIKYECKNKPKDMPHLGIVWEEV